METSGAAACRGKRGKSRPLEEIVENPVHFLLQSGKGVISFLAGRNRTLSPE
jgi:hypothetical protein